MPGLAACPQGWRLLALLILSERTFQSLPTMAALLSPLCAHFQTPAAVDQLGVKHWGQPSWRTTRGCPHCVAVQCSAVQVMGQALSNIYMLIFMNSDTYNPCVSDLEP